MERDDEAGARDGAPYQPTVAEAVERVGGRIANAIVIAAMIVGVVVWMQPGPPRYQVVADGERIVRIDTRRGSVISCEDRRCTLVLRRGQRLERRHRGDEAEGDQPAEPQRQLAPQQQQQQQPAPQAPSPEPAKAPGAVPPR